MREHRYRAWHKTKNVMVYFDLWELLQYYNDESDYCRIADTDLFKAAGDTEHLEVMEYTCFTDKNGQQMCEDDIVIRNGNPRFRYRVIFSESHGRWALRSLFHVRGDKPGYIALSRKPERCEVIGNVWENQELLKVGTSFD